MLSTGQALLRPVRHLVLAPGAERELSSLIGSGCVSKMKGMRSRRGWAAHLAILLEPKRLPVSKNRYLAYWVYKITLSRSYKETEMHF